MIDNCTEVFKQFQPMVEGFAWKAHRKYHLELDDAKGMAYEIFCITFQKYDPEQASFSTYLYGSLEHRLRNYALNYKQKSCRKEFSFIDDIDEVQIADIRYGVFSDTMDRLEESLELPSDAQDIIDFIIGREWEIPGYHPKNYAPRFSFTKKWFETNGWNPIRIKRAWEEARRWWHDGVLPGYTLKHLLYRQEA